MTFNTEDMTGQKPTPQNGDSPNFKGELVAYERTLKRYLVFRTGSETDAHDLAQEAYLRILRVKEPDLIEQPTAYLFRIAQNLANEFLLNRKQQQESKADLEEWEAQGDGDEGSFERQVEARASLERLNKLLDKLPKHYKSILLLRKQEGLSHTEIAEKLNISTHTVHRYLTRALVQLRLEWEE